MPEAQSTPENEEPQSKNELHKNEWMLRACAVYKEEYNDCKSIAGRFHQYFVFGEYLDCTQWKEDYDNCYKWKKYKSEEAFEKLINSERVHRRERLQGHYNNDVWQRRDKPPENWNVPLPDWLEKKVKSSYLNCVKDKLIMSSENQKYPESSCILM